MKFELKERFDSAVSEMVRTHNLMLNKLTERQLVEAIKQAILAGDFERLVGPDGAQSVSYIPFRDVERLKARIAQLESEVSGLRHHIDCLALSAVAGPAHQGCIAAGGADLKDAKSAQDLVGF